LNKPKTCVIEGRVDIRDLATIARYLQLVGNLPPSKSALISEVVGAFADVLVMNKLIDQTTDTIKGVQELERLGFSMGGESRSGQRNRRTYLKQIQKETLEADQIKGPQIAVDSPEAKEAMKMFEQMQRDQKD
tara:strand:+ start:904 stop:1302 length:399 start_codon:yes stop_codon:yes gene_type:complete